MYYELALRVCEILKPHGEIYFVGGFVRDKIIAGATFDPDTKEIDLSTALPPDEVCKILSNHGIPAIYDHAKSFGVVRIPTEKEDIEIATFRTEGNYSDGRRPDWVHFTSSLEEDAKRRDFTCNALYWDPIEDRLIDRVGGIPDIENKVLRTVGAPEERFQEDHLRMIRYARFRCKLGFRFSRPIRDCIRTLALLILKISPERIKMEFDKALNLPNSHKFVHDLERTGLLRHILPEVSDLKAVKHPPAVYHREGDVYRHTLTALRAASIESDDLPVKWAVLLHDTGKKNSRKEEKGKIHFIGHEDLSAEIAEKVCKRLRFSDHEKDMIVWLVQNHLKARNIPIMRKGKQRALLRDPRIRQLLLLYHADSAANYGTQEENEPIFRKCLELYREEPKDEERVAVDQTLKYLTDGEWIMEQFSLPPGPLVGKIKSRLTELYLEGTFHSREEIAEMTVDELLAEGKAPLDVSFDR